MEWKWLWLVLVAFLLGGWFECEGCSEQEKAALLQLKPFFPHIDDVEDYGVESEHGSYCCEWERVECNASTGRVIRLFLNHTSREAWPGEDIVILEQDETRRGYHWYLNASLFLPFEELKSLNLAGNSIAGCVENQGFERLSSKLDKLEILDLSDNYFNDSILTSLSELSSLKSLYLAENYFTGSNPNDGMKRLSKLNKLQTLDLQGNILRNNILSHLLNFTSLKYLRLQNCGLKGTFDLLELNNLINLKELYLGQNEIESLGSLFQNKRQLRLIKLEVLGLSYNLFNDNIFPSLAALSNLKSLYIGGNILKGAMPIKELNALSRLEELYMWNNEVNDFVPSQDNENELKLMNLKVLDLSWNLFNVSVLASLARLPNLKSLFLQGQNLERSIDFRGLDALTNLEELRVGCDGPRACSFPLPSFDIFPSLKSLYLSGFSFSKALTAQEWKILTSLEELALEHSSLSFHFIQSIGTLTSLKNLHMSLCELNGGLDFHEWKSLTSLEELRLDHLSLPPDFIQDIGTLTALKKLDISYCDVNGSLNKPGFCELTNLQRLYLSNNNLKGNLPECFSNLTSLERLDLSSNQFSGNISVLKSLTSLESLDLSSNQFSENISPLKNLKSLEELILSNNNFEIPSSIRPLFNLSKLQYVYADNNIIYAEIKMHSLVPKFHLKFFRLSCCGDVRSFPHFLYHQNDLRVVDLSKLNLTGEFPIWLLENNKNLQTLALANNSLDGYFELPFLQNIDLSFLDISKNFFYGNIPDEIGAKLPSLQFLNVSKNYFGGSIPDSIGDMKSLLILDLSNNNLIGGVPEHLTMGCSSLEVLVLSNNRLQGHMFSSNFKLTNLKQLQLDGNQFYERIPNCLSNCSFLLTLDLSNNQLYGGIPKWMGNMSSLEELIMANNSLQGPIPKEFCHLNLNLKLLDLSMNKISGSLPSCFSPSWIRQVHLSRNKLQGPLTNAFHNSTILMTLDLSDNHLTGNIPNWIGKLSQLSYLLLNNNQFEGRIPIQLCKLGNLSLINLSNNNLSGTIPPCLKITTLNQISQAYAKIGGFESFFHTFSIEQPIEFTIKKLTYSYKGKVLSYFSGIDLSCNKLTGEIPREVKNFQKIRVLNLSHNSLTGTIPPALSDLRQMESLDLSYNNLSGKIPPQLVGLSFLSFFSVAYNNLSGSTPARIGQFALLEESSYLGNPFLCGAPLPKCSTDAPLSSIPKASTDNDLIDMKFFKVSFVASYIMVLLSIASVLYINPYWRQAWFYHIEAGITSCYYFFLDNILPNRFNCRNI